MSAPRYTKFSRLTQLERVVRESDGLDKVSDMRSAIWFQQMVDDSFNYPTLEEALADLFEVEASERYLDDLADLQAELRA